MAIPEENRDPLVSVDWEGLTQALQNDKKKWTPVAGGEYFLDTEGLKASLGYDEEERKIVDSYKTRVGVTVDDQGTPWYEAMFVDAPNWIADKGMESFAVISPLGVIAGLPYVWERWLLDKDEGNIEAETGAATKRLEELGKTGGKVTDNPWWKEGLMGVEEGTKQFLELLTGGKAETLEDKLDQLEIAGMVHKLQQGDIDKEEFTKYTDWLKEREENIPLQRDIVAGITNSMMIMGSLLSGGGLAQMSMRGLSIFSKAGFKKYGINALKMGAQTWKLMKYGATVGAIGDAVLEAKDAANKGEDHDFWDWTADLVMNMGRKHSQAFAEGMSEGLLLNMRLGSVNLKKWLGKPIKTIVNGKEVTKHMGIRELRQLVNKLPKGTPKQLAVKKLLAQTITDRKQIAKQISKNFGTRMMSALGVETATEQVTDAWSDLIEPDSYSSAIWLALGNDEQKKSALRNLIIEASVGLFLGTSMGFGEVWSRKPLEEIEEKFGKDVAREIETTINGEKMDNLKKKVIEAKGEGNVIGKQEANTTASILEQGSGNETPLTDDASEKAIMETIKGRTPEYVAHVIESVDNLVDANILDYNYQLGKLQTQAFLEIASKKDSKQSPEEASGHFEYTIDSYLMQANDETVHAVLEPAYVELVRIAGETGVVDKIGFTNEKEKQLRKDLAVGIILNFGDQGWNFIKHKYQSNETIDTKIDQARVIQQNNELEPKPRGLKFIKMKGPKTIADIKVMAKHELKTQVANNIGLAKAQVGTIVTDGGIAGKLEEDEIIPESVGGGIISAEPVFDETGDVDITQLGEGYGLNDLTSLEFEKEDAPTMETLVDKATKMGNLVGINYEGFQVFPSESGTNDIVLSFLDPVTKGRFEIQHSSLKHKKLQDLTTKMRGGTPMKSVALQYEGTTYERGSGHTHPSLVSELFETEKFTDEFWDKYEKGEVVEGFVDEDGKFYDREQAKLASGVGGESVSQGVSTDLNKLLFETTIPDASFTMPTYNEILKNFKGETIADLVEYFVEIGAINEETREVAAKLLPIVGHRKAIIATFAPHNPGATHPDTLDIYLNTSATLWGQDSPWNSMIHEMLHSYLHGFMNSDTTLAKTFNGKIKGVMSIVRQVLEANPNNELFKNRWLGDASELQVWKKEHLDLITKALKSPEEFIASVMSDTQKMKWITDRIDVGGPNTRLTGWRKIWAAIRKPLESLGIARSATQELQNVLERSSRHIELFNKGKNRGFSAKAAKEHRRLASNVTSGFEEFEYNKDEAEDDLLDPEQISDDILDEDENLLEKESIENFIRFTANIMNVTEPELREAMQTQMGYYGRDGFKAYQKDMQELDEQNSNIITKKLEHLYGPYKRNFKSFEHFKTAFLKRKYLNVIHKQAKTGFIFMGVNETDINTGKRIYHYEVRKVEGTYRDGNGKKRNTYKRRTALESYIPEFERMLGLPEGTFNIAYMEGFETWRNGKVTKRSSIDRLDSYVFDQPYIEGAPVTGYLADMLWGSSNNQASSDGMLYLGTFAGKNTLPILTFDPQMKSKVIGVLEKFELEYGTVALEEFEGEFETKSKLNPYTEARRMASTARTLLEDIWFKQNFRKIPDGYTLTNEATNVVDNTVARNDWNKVQKRGTKWNASDTGIVITEEEYADTFGNASVNGVRYQDDDVIFQTAVIKSNDENGISFTLPNNKEINAPLRVLLQNELGTSTIDGASFYIIGHFDKIYNVAHGVLKDGAIKNLYSSRFGDDPIFIKHAMHGVTKDSPIGKLMMENGISILVADESMKEGPKDDKSIGALELQDKAAFNERSPIIELKLSQFTRISESEYKDPMSGSTKQIAGGSAFSDLYNEVIQELGGEIGLNDIMKDFTNAMTQEAAQWFKENSTPEALHNLLKDVVYNPRSPQEQSVSEIWVDYIEPLEGQTEEDVINKYGGFYHHAHTAEVLRNRLQHRLSQLLGGKTAGSRATLDPNAGYLNYQKDVAPIETTWNLGNLLVNLELDSKLAQAAFPENGLRTLARDLVEKQKEEARAHSQLFGEDKRIKLKEIQEERDEIIAMVKELDGDRIEIKDGTKKLSPHQLINWSHPSVQTWKDEIVYGTVYTDPDTKELQRKKDGILDETTGRLRGDWTIITEDIADMHGIKPGDWVLAVVTPTDSPTGVRMVRVGGIAKSKESARGDRKVSDNNKATFNSEWLQTMVGKDFDIDTISIMPYDPRFWKPDNWNALVKIGRQIPDAYAKKVAQETQALLDEHKQVVKDADGKVIEINKDSVFQHDIVRQTYSMLMNGTTKTRKRRRFSMQGTSFIELDSAYLHDPAPIINERVFHTATSAMNMRSNKVNVPFITKDGRIVDSFKVNDKKKKIAIDFNVRNKHWLRLHINHLHMTNAEVDFPNKTTRLAYISNPRSTMYRIVMGSYFWGLGSERDMKLLLKLDADPALKLANADTMFKTLKQFQKALFDDSFNLARQRDPNTFEKLDYYQTIQQLRRAQNKLDILARNDKPGLYSIIDDFIKKETRELERRTFKDSPDHKAGLMILKQKEKFLKSFVDNMEIDNVYDYPLFNTIKNINAEEMLEDMPGNTYKDHLINQVLASLEMVTYYPGLKVAYDGVIDHAPDNKLFQVGERIARKPAEDILRILHEPAKRPVQAVRDFLRHPERVEAVRKKLLPSELQDFNDAVVEFKRLEARIGKPFEPFERDGGLVHVDEETIALSLLVGELDYKEGRKKQSRKNLKQYWFNQIRSLRAEANSILHAFDEENNLDRNRKELSDQLEMIRMAHAVVFPKLWKSILNTPFLFVSNKTNVTSLFNNGKEIKVTHDGGGQLVFLFNGRKYTHNEVNDQKSDETKALYNLLTERNGLFEGTSDTKQGTFNRIAIGRLISMPRNITMERRTEILEEHIADNLYDSTRGFTHDDQRAFWVGLLGQTSDQGMLERKATGFIVNQSAYNPQKPFKYQSNHVAINLLSKFEPEMLNTWMQLYSHAEGLRTPSDKEFTRDKLKAGIDADVEMLYEDAPVAGTESTLRHYFSDYVKEHQKLAKDSSFIKFYRFMRGADWKKGLDKLRDLAKSNLMLKALSENGVFYEDVVKDLQRLSNQEFFNKYKGIDTTHIRLAIERYMGDGTVDEFLRQKAGESDVEFRSRGNIISLYYLLNGVKKREGARNKKLNFMRRLASNVVGYDMVAMLGEKQTRVMNAKDEVVGFVWDSEVGPKSITSHEAQLAMRTHATRTFIPVGESVIAITKGQRINRSLSTHQVTLNNQAKRYDDAVKLMSDVGYRDKWRAQFGHKQADARVPHTERTRYLTEQLDLVGETDDRQLEVRRKQVFELAEDLKKRSSIWVDVKTDGTITYNMKLGKTYTYTSVARLIETHLPKLKPIQKIALVGAIDMRIMYDIQVPAFLKQALSYLQHTRADLMGFNNIDTALKVDAIIKKYQDMLEASQGRRGDYMPHQFPIARYREMWMKGYLDSQVRKIELDIAYHKKHKTGSKLSRLDPVKDATQIREMAHKSAIKTWDTISYGWTAGTIIPNFMKRTMPDAVGYTKTDPTVHFSYITKMIEGLKKDALLADWYMYQSNARLAGERTAIIELTRQWYADQVGNKDLRANNQSWDKIKVGQDINFATDAFIIDPSSDVGFQGSAQVSGVVAKIDGDKVTLQFDREQTLWQARQDLKRWENAITSMLAHGTGQFQNASQRQWNNLQAMLNKGLIEPADFSEVNLTELSTLDAADIMIKGIKRIIKNPERLNVYDRTNIYGTDASGKAIPNSVNRYVGHGAVERLQAKRDEFHNLQLIAGEFGGSIPTMQYNLLKGAAAVTSGAFSSFKKLAGLLYMGMGALFKARIVNQTGATINNLVDAPWYNFQRWREGNDIWSRIRHGNLEMMDESDQSLYKTLVGLGLTENNNILAIALEAANIKPEDMLINEAKPEAIKWLAKLFRDAFKYDATYKALEKKTHEYNMATNPQTKLNITQEINQIKAKWEAKMYKVLSKEELEKPLTQAEEANLWKKLNELSKTEPKLNIAQEQGFTALMAAKLMGKVAWKTFYTSNLGMGFQAKAERLRIPAFFIGYTTARRMGYTHEDAVQLGVNAIELRHAFYGAANKQFGANTKIGTVAFQYAQYQYNAIGKMVRVMREAVPQMLRFAHNRPETVTRLKHMGNLLKHVQVATDSKGKELKQGKVTLKEVNLAHGIMMKVGITAVMMQLGTRIFYGITNSQDPVGQVAYRGFDFLLDVILGGGLDVDDEDDRDNLAWMIQDLALPLGLLYKLGIQSATTAPVKGMDETYFRGRVDDSFDFIWRATNTMEQALYELGATDKKPHRKNRTFFDLPWLVDDFGSGIKLMGWTSADKESHTYKKRKLYYGFNSDLTPYFRVEERPTKSFGQGRYVETKGKGISGFGDNRSRTRFLYLLDPLSYVPFLDRFITGK